MKKQLLLFAMILLPLVASAHNIEVKNADGVTIYYNYINNGTELEVTFRGSNYDSFSGEYQGNVAIPEEVTYMKRTRKVTSIGNGAFFYCYKLTSVTIGNSVTSIGNGAFSNCYGLTSVTIPNSVTSIGLTAFSGCHGLTSVTIPNSVTSIGNDAFSGCYGLTSITIGNSVTSIGSGAFHNCNGLKKVIVSDIAAWCSIKFGSSYANPLSYAHRLYIDDNTEITDLVIPNSVTSIGGYAYNGCSHLTSIIIGSGVKNIGDYAFGNCSKLADVYCYAETVPSTEGDVFTYITYDTLHVPTASVDAYKAVSPWKNFKEIVALKEGDPGSTGITNIKNDKKDSQYYDLKGNRLEKPVKGINIINGKKVFVK